MTMPLRQRRLALHPIAALLLLPAAALAQDDHAAAPELACRWEVRESLERTITWEGDPDEGKTEVAPRRWSAEARGTLAPQPEGRVEVAVAAARWEGEGVVEAWPAEGAAPATLTWDPGGASLTGLDEAPPRLRCWLSELFRGGPPRLCPAAWVPQGADAEWELGESAAALGLPVTGFRGTGRRLAEEGTRGFEVEARFTPTLPEPDRLEGGAGRLELRVVISERGRSAEQRLEAAGNLDAEGFAGRRRRGRLSQTRRKRIAYEALGRGG